MITAIVLAAGRGIRAGEGVPKQYRRVGGQALLRRALACFVDHPDVSQALPVIHPGDAEFFQAACGDIACLPPVSGGASRQASVRAALEALVHSSPDIVLIHDAARPFASKTLISRVIAATRESGAAIPALPILDTVKSVDETGSVLATLDRRHLWAAQTPQGFAFTQILDAHRRVAGRDDFTDDASIAEAAGLKVAVVEGEAHNIKLTTAEDFTRVDSFSYTDMRVGAGYDVHAFMPGDHVTLGGVKIPHVRALAGHSDADVVLHAITDAVLGALAEGDIGSHFPPSDPQWRGAESCIFLRHAASLVAARGGLIAHIDATLICEAPTIGPYRDAMRQRIADISGIDRGRVSVKATTSEQLGFTGRKEGIAASATVTLRLPSLGVSS